jgi:hypothetical protein
MPRDDERGFAFQIEHVASCVSGYAAQCPERYAVTCSRCVKTQQMFLNLAGRRLGSDRKFYVAAA